MIMDKFDMFLKKLSDPRIIFIIGVLAIFIGTWMASGVAIAGKTLAIVSAISLVVYFFFRFLIFECD